MKIRVFQSDKGDCLLLTSSSGKHRVLVDGGMTSSYTTHVAPNLAKTKASGKPPKLDLVYVSHIDDDHIAGVLQLMNDLLDWRVFDFQQKKKKSGDKAPKKPKSPRPPEVAKIWHNAFHELLKDNEGEISDMLAASTAVLSSSHRPMGKAIFEQHSDLALSKKQALQLARRTGSDQLDIPVNPEFKHKLMLLTSGSPQLKVGTMKFTVLGPSQGDLDKLRDEWNDWLRENKAALAEIRRKAKQDEDRLKSDVDRLLAPLTMQANEFVDFQIALAKKLGDRTEVTTPNLASLMLLAREGSQSILLTGDGHADDVIKGLKANNLLDAQGRLHVDVLKVPHHGSEHNMTAPFAQSITADDYIFCGNGFSTNPEVDVIDLLVKERKKALPNKPFTFWFNSTSALTNPKYRKHMRAVEKAVAAHVSASAGKLKVKWITGSFMDL
jgi:metallo-beta-lactamase superfamily protein